MGAVVGSALGALLGGVYGGFVPRVVERLAVPYGEPWRAVCARCGRPFDEWPLGGWLRFGGPCAGCRGGPGSAIAPVLVGAVMAAVLCRSIGIRPELPAFLLAGASGVVLAFVDLRCLRLPNAVVGRTFLGVLALLAAAGVTEGHVGLLPRALLGGLVLFCGYLLLHLISPTSMGRGDVNLAAVLGLCLGWLGWGSVLVGFCAASLAGLPVSLYLLCFRPRDRRPQIPYGPYLLVGALVAVALHR